MQNQHNTNKAPVGMTKKTGRAILAAIDACNEEAKEKGKATLGEAERVVPEVIRKLADMTLSSYRPPIAAGRRAKYTTATSLLDPRLTSIS